MLPQNGSIILKHKKRLIYYLAYIKSMRELKEYKIEENILTVGSLS